MGGFERVVKRVILNAIGKCGTCGRSYDIGSIEVVGHQDDLWFVQLSCKGCRSRGLVAALVREQAQQAEVVTDFTEAELESLHERSLVVADDVLDMHEFLQSFDGDFASLFSKRR